MRRRRGTGSIEQTAQGRHRVRAPGTEQRSLGVYETRAEAEAVLAAALTQLADVHHGAGATLQQWAERVLDQREADGLRGVAEERNRWLTYVEGDPLSRLPIRTIDRRDVLRWLDTLRARRATRPAKGGRRTTGARLSRRTVLNALTLLRAVLEHAAQHSVMTANPARDVALPRDTGRTHEPWTYLAPDEQEAVARAGGPIVAFAIGTGLRQGEQWALRVEDVHVAGPRPRVVVRYGSAGKPTKSGRIREVPLFGLGLAAAVAALEALRARKKRREPRSGDGLLFPSLRGEHRKPGAPKGFARALAAAGIDRHVRWHDLRHTCASSLVAGWWGRAWSLEEVRALLGHSSIAVTERYAHLAGTLVERAAAATPGGERSTRGEGSDGAKSLSHLSESNRRPTVYETAPVANDSNGAEPLSTRARGYAALAAAAEGDPLAGRRLVEALAGLLEEREAERGALASALR